MRASITMLAPLPRSRLALVLEAGAKHAAALQEVPTGAKLKSKETLERAKARRLEREKAQKQIKKLARTEPRLPPPAGAPQLQRQNAKVYLRAGPLFEEANPRANWTLKEYGDYIKALREEIKAKTQQARELQSAWLAKKEKYGAEAADIEYYIQRDAYARLRSLQAELDLLTKEQEKLVQEELNSMQI